ncbi:MAG: response regulator [Candidatus Aminicenantes bacterium]|nr:response regulator [Candidatus Aminicenantes bacterium]
MSRGSSREQVSNREKTILKKSPNILIVEDENIIALDIQNTIEDFGWKVCAITSKGEESIRMAEKFRPDLVLMDIRLKGKMNGTAAAKIISDTLNIPIIYLTAYRDKEKKVQMIQNSLSGYIQKPFSQNELHSKMKEILSQIKKYPKTN